MSRKIRAAAACLPVLTMAAACPNEPLNALWQIQPGMTVYIDGWDQDNEVGDQALVEQKTSQMWVIPRDAEFRNSRSNGFTVEVQLDRRRGFVVTDLGGVRVGRDHDYCLEEGETYVTLDVRPETLRWEPAPDDVDVSGDDCVLDPAGD
ncbi:MULTISPECIES: hypothetical protein [Actinomadura]|uniref:hypothetical protein n=1 Tax=Actinomadura TaxID=1988 RepID=UPI00054FA70E|nr:MULTISPECIES: hypothetical protein [Actinomadura]RSN67788.1 hypothetical protein DMH08_12595 [Actinomadura sp. WAC 06369]